IPIKDMIKWLKIVCFNCGKIIIPYIDLKVPKHKILAEYVKITRTANKNLKCTHCGAVHPHVVKDQADPVSIYMEIYEAKSAASQTSGSKSKLIGRAPLYPHLIKAIFDKVTPSTVAQLGKPAESHPRKLTIDFLRVPPNSIRPDVKK